MKVEKLPKIIKGDIGENQIIIRSTTGLVIECNEKNVDHVLRLVSPIAEIKSTESLINPPLSYPSLPERTLSPPQKSYRAIIMITLLVIIGSVLLLYSKGEYRERQANFLIEHKIAIERDNIHRQIMAANLNSLLEYLEELVTSSSNFKETFLDIRNMNLIVRFKRGPTNYEKAKEAKEFILVVKGYFDKWVKNPLNYIQGPDKEDILSFDSIWKETEILLESLKRQEATIYSRLEKEKLLAFSF